MTFHDTFMTHEILTFAYFHGTDKDLHTMKIFVKA